MCFSATMEGDMARLVKDYTENAVRIALGSTLKPAENVRLHAYEVAANGKLELLRRLLIQESGRCLVFSRTKRGTEKIAKGLQREGIAAATIAWRSLAIATHGGADRVPARTLPRTCGHGPCGARHPRGADCPRHQLRFARGRGEFHPSGRTHRDAPANMAWLPHFSATINARSSSA